MPDKPNPADQVRLAIPARPDFVHVLRAVASGMASRLDFRYDDLEDLSLAIDEACAYLLRMQPGALTLSLLLTPLEGGVLDVRASVDAPSPRVPPADAHQWMIWHVLGALTDGASLEQGDGGPAIRFTKRGAA
jgi:serine/threonine-protein kinase RsbW